MEKISKIVPLSPRMRSVNVGRSQAARPGAPEYGRPPGKNSLAEQLESLGEKFSPQQVGDRVNFSNSDSISQPQESKGYKKMDPKLKSIDHITEKFNLTSKPTHEISQSLEPETGGSESVETESMSRPDSSSEEIL